MSGPRVRTDVVDVYVFRRIDEIVELLQLRRVEGVMAGTWQPVMGHVRDGESAPECAVRELREETGLVVGSSDWRGLWALEQVHPFYLPGRDAIMLSPRFACQAAPGWEPRLDAEHDAARWVSAAEVQTAFLWPGQRAALKELVEWLDRGPAAMRQIQITTHETNPRAS